MLNFSKKLGFKGCNSFHLLAGADPGSLSDCRRFSAVASLGGALRGALPQRRSKSILHAEVPQFALRSLGASVSVFSRDDFRLHRAARYVSARVTVTA